MEQNYKTTISYATGIPVPIVKKRAIAVPVQPAIMPPPPIIAPAVQPLVAAPIILVQEPILSTTRPSGGGGAGGGGGSQKESEGTTEAKKAVGWSDTAIGISTASGVLAGAGVGFLVGKAVKKGIVWFTIGGAVLFG